MARIIIFLQEENTKVGGLKVKKKTNKFDLLEDELADVSMFGEFISSFHRWVSSEEQKSKVEKLQSIGKKHR